MIYVDLNNMFWWWYIVVNFIGRKHKTTHSQFNLLDFLSGLLSELELEMRHYVTRGYVGVHILGAHARRPMALYPMSVLLLVFGFELGWK